MSLCTLVFRSFGHRSARCLTSPLHRQAGAGGQAAGAGVGERGGGAGEGGRVLWGGSERIKSVSSGSERIQRIGLG
jgi:hypothetical protein